MLRPRQSWLVYKLIRIYDFKIEPQEVSRFLSGVFDEHFVKFALILPNICFSRSVDHSGYSLTPPPGLRQFTRLAAYTWRFPGGLIQRRSPRDFSNRFKLPRAATPSSRSHGHPSIAFTHGRVLSLTVAVLINSHGYYRLSRTDSKGKTSAYDFWNTTAATPTNRNTWTSKCPEWSSTRGTVRTRTTTTSHCWDWTPRAWNSVQPPVYIRFACQSKVTYCSLKAVVRLSWF